MYTVDQKIIELIDYLKSINKIKTQKEFCDLTEIPRQRIVSVKNQGRHFSGDQIESVIKVFKIDANYLFGVSDKPFK